MCAAISRRKYELLVVKPWEQEYDSKAGDLVRPGSEWEHCLAGKLLRLGWIGVSIIGGSVTGGGGGRDADKVSRAK